VRQGSDNGTSSAVQRFTASASLTSIPSNTARPGRIKATAGATGHTLSQWYNVLTAIGANCHDNVGQTCYIGGKEMIHAVNAQ
jgi:hypothetical protein